MLLVDTSVWIDYLNGLSTPATIYLDQILGNEPVLMGDLVLAEILQGLRNDNDFDRSCRAFLKLPQVNLLSTELAIQAARNFRTLRQKGYTPRKLIDCLVATYCMENQHILLHNDHDFDPFEKELGLQVLHLK